MAKHMPCADCGQMMQRGATSLPEGKARCLPCRRLAQDQARPSRMQTWTCAACGVECSRIRVKGQVPRWCADCRRRGQRGTQCSDCDVQISNKSTGRCLTCTMALRPKQPKPPLKTADELAATWRNQRGDLRAAVEDGDHSATLAAILADCVVDDAGCWIWQRVTKAGYPIVVLNRKQNLVHRLSLEAKHGAALGSQPAHHMCAVTQCVNPDHLQPVTHRDNIAEMLARHAYLDRIAELEDALASLSPHHPLLALIAVA